MSSSRYFALAYASRAPTTVDKSIDVRTSCRMTDSLRGGSRPLIASRAVPTPEDGPAAGGERGMGHACAVPLVDTPSIIPSMHVRRYLHNVMQTIKVLIERT